MKHITLLKTWFIALALMIFGAGDIMADKFIKINNHSDVTADGVYLIVDVTSGKALTSANLAGSAPTAVSVPLAGDVIEGSIADDLKWQFTAADGGYTIYPADDNTKWLYSTGVNNGIRVGTNANKVFELNVTDAEKPDYKGFKHVATSRYLGVYNNQDWRTYTSVHSNIEKTQIEIFELDTSIPVNPTIGVQGVVEMLAIVNGVASETVNVKGTNLTAGITVSGAVAPFTVTPTSLGVEGGDLTITYSPTTAGTHTATLTLSSAGANNRTIELSGEAFATAGDGSKTNPFTVADVFALDNSTGTDEYWVKGYIVGGVPQGNGGVITSVQTSDFGNTALTLADDADEEDLTKMIPVQLLAADIRTALNLADNPANYKQEVHLYGKLEAYFTVPGVKGLTDYELFVTGVTELDAPVAIAANGVTASTFTANWNAVTDAEEYVLNVYTKEISQAGEELVANGGFEDEDLSAWTFEHEMDETIATDVVKSGSQSLKIRVEATKKINQEIAVETGKTYTMSLYYFLDENSTGTGWRVWTTKGADFQSSGYLSDKGSWQYVEHEFEAEDDEVTLEFRIYTGATLYLDDISIKEKAGVETIKPITGSPFTVTGTSHGVTGLADETDYYYVVKAVAGAVESDWSNEVKVTTDISVGIESIANVSSVFAQNDRVMINTTAGTLIEIFNISGQKISATVAHDGLNTIPVVNKGVLLVKVGEEVTKVVM